MEQLNSTMDELNNFLKNNNLSKEESLILHNQTIVISAKLSVLNKFEGELKKELNILNEKIEKIKRGKATGENNSLANLQIH